MGWWPSGLGSTIDRRVWASPTWPTISIPWSSGPRWWSAPARRSRASRSGTRPGRTTHPPMPHTRAILCCSPTAPGSAVGDRGGMPQTQSHGALPGVVAHEADSHVPDVHRQRDASVLHDSLPGVPHSRRPVDVVEDDDRSVLGVTGDLVEV